MYCCNNIQGFVKLFCIHKCLIAICVLKNYAVNFLVAEGYI
jgi:hypothetical protein